MLIRRFVFNDFGVNTYVVANEKSGNAIIIDPGMYSDNELVVFDDFIKNYKLKVELVVLTHGHFDHWFGAYHLQETGAKVLMHKEDVVIMEKSAEIASDYNLNVTRLPHVDAYLDDGQVIEVGGVEMRVIHTPGHSPGHVCLVLDSEKIMFTGDLIFKNTIGRTDIPGGDYVKLADSIKNKILPIKDNYTLLPGHGVETTLADELLNNPFIMNIINQ